ncbi:MAG: hypothetical protein V1721_10040 [Pseudomonadota bacterium]
MGIINYVNEGGGNPRLGSSAAVSPGLYKFLVFAFCLLISGFWLLTSSPAYAACSSPVGSDGDMMYNADYHVPQYCDGTNWRAIGTSGSGGAGCSGPAGNEGDIMYNTDYHVLQFCDGAAWRAMGTSGSGGAGCSGPVGSEGDVMHNALCHVPQFCDGAAWRVMGKASCDPCDGSPSVGTVCADGSVYAGLSPDGNVKMFAMSGDLGLYTWNDGSANWLVTGFTNATTGEANTTGLVALGIAPSPAPYKAARACAAQISGGHSDWYLPAKNELNVLWTNRVAIGGFNLTGSYPAGYYWSSSEGLSLSSWLQWFSVGSQFNDIKVYALSVRCVRR